MYVRREVSAYSLEVKFLIEFVYDGLFVCLLLQNSKILTSPPALGSK